MRLFNQAKAIAIDLDVLGGDPLDPTVPFFARLSLAYGGEFSHPQILGSSKEDVTRKVNAWASSEGFHTNRPINFKGR